MVSRKVIKVDEAEIKAAAKSIKKTRLDLPHIRFSENLKTHDDPLTGKLMSSNLMAVEDSLLSFFGTYQSVKNSFMENKIFESLTQKYLSSFVNIYSLNISAETTKNSLEDILTRDITLSSRHDFDFDKGNYSILSNLINTYMSGIKNLNGSSENIVAVTKDYFNWIKDETEKSAKEECYSEFIKQAKNFDIEVNRQIFNGFVKLKDNIEISSNQELTYDSIVGNDDVIGKAKQFASFIACYNPEIRENNIINSKKTLAIGLVGRPGTGKSMIINAIRNDMEHYAAAKGIPFSYVSVDNTKIKDKYIGEGVKSLNELFKKVKDPNGIGLMAWDDIDQVLDNRDDAKINGSGRELLHEVQKNMDGLDKDYKGNYLIVASSNRPDKFDEAIGSRIGEKNLFEVKGPSNSDEYLRLFKNLLSDDIKYLNMDDKEFKLLGSELYKTGISGREVSTFVDSVQRLINPNVIPLDVILMRGEEQRSALSSLKKNIEYKSVFNELEAYK